MNYGEFAMLLNPKDFTFKELKGFEGMSGTKYLGTPKDPEDSPRILVKCNYTSDMPINEYVGCNLGRMIGVNTPRAWLFVDSTKGRINFHNAVAIEYLDGLDEKWRHHYDTEEYAIQTIQSDILHILMNDSDVIRPPAYFQGKLYAYDFGEGLFPDLAMAKTDILVGDCLKRDNGFTRNQWTREVLEDKIRRRLRQYIKRDHPVEKELVIRVYLDMRDKYITVCKNKGLNDMLREIAVAYSNDISEWMNNYLHAMQMAYFSF